MEEYSYTSTQILGHTGPVTGTLYFTLLYFTTVIDFSLCGSSPYTIKDKTNRNKYA